jgi:deoxyadenosine/deoxycytidine kinase
MTRISLEGNCCSGKTFYLKLLEQNGYIVHYDEQFDQSELTQKYSKDMKRYSLGYYLQKLYNHTHYPHKDTEIHIFENSPYTLKNVYCTLLHEKHCFDEDEYKIYENYTGKLGWTPDVIIYLYCNPNVCYERSVSRGKSYSPSIDYLKDLHLKYEITCDELNCPIAIYKINSQDESHIVLNNIKDIIDHLETKHTSTDDG